MIQIFPAAEAPPQGGLIAVLLCSYRRPHVLRTLASLAELRPPPGFRIEIFLADNAPDDSARPGILAVSMPWPLHYIAARPSGNISVARNAGLEAAIVAKADWIAFIDDDEIAPPDWLEILMAEARQNSLDGVAGTAQAIYPTDTPAWMAEQDWHSNRPEHLGKEQTIFTCNALLRWQGTPWQGLRFAPERGRTGGEDTQFFQEAAAKGACYGISATSVVTEEVTPERLSLAWLRTRRFRMGQTHAAGVRGFSARLRLALTAAGKAGYCALRSLIALPSTGGRNFWILRGALHLGVVAGCLGIAERAHYGA